MASAGYEEQFHCSICLDVFNEPVSTPCGHNYCKGCITGYWALGDVSHCPLCYETFPKTPKLRVNTEFRDILELFKRTRAAGDGAAESPDLPWTVPCDLCHGTKAKAVKSCLVCLVSYCDAHLEPHRTVQALRWHKLMEPVETLEERACKKHNKPKEFFCRDDRSCICAACVKDVHAAHQVVSLEDEVRERRTELKCMRSKVNQALREVSVEAERIQSSVARSRLKVEKIKAEAVRRFAALVALIETRKEELMELVEEKQRAVEQEAGALLGRLQTEITKNQTTSTKLEELSETQDDFKLLQDLPAVSSSENTADCSRFRAPSFLHVDGLVRSAVVKVEETLSEQVENILRDLLDGEEEATDSQTEFNDDLGEIQRKYFQRVTLDANTAHPSLIVSGDGKQVRDGGSKRTVPDSSSRFDCLHYVLGNEGFSSGCFYYEVKTGGQTFWEVGVTKESISKKGTDLSLSPENGCWTLGSYWGRCQANANPPVVLLLPKVPQRVGVFVDYEGKLVSFYDIDTRARIYSFTGCTFNAAPPPPRSSLMQRVVYTGTQTKTKLYPIFRPSSEDSAPLRITPVRH
ncbi:E3 ubiquitin-protein ligase TRIM39-like [Mugil cephalus]|uniref:E3 ubiquitin-protein ligase TRIM39-like n=1 Tax=Mugil cephalus TaxID=48193 RepID=UPI001FB7F450|nr:E3 ubiquitin-protein ligase TRIM39-like [Mugil cephalus]